MYRMTVAWLVRRGYSRLVAGDPRFMLRLAAPDIRFRFPGTSSFGADLHSRAELATWLNPEFVVHDVVVTGPPWRTRVAVRFSDAIGDDYRNTGCEYLQLRWGKAQSVDVFLDTHVITAWEAKHPAELATA